MIKRDKDLSKKDRLTLTPRESMRVTGFGSNYTYEMLRTGRMPSIKVGKKFFIPRSALLKWLENAGSPTA